MGSSTFTLAGREFPKVTWWKEPCLRKLYILIFMVILTSATSGYDGSMMNGLQSLDIWQDYFKHPGPSMLGLLNAIMPVGSIVALAITPYIADNLGRRMGVVIGAIFMIGGVILQTLSVNIKMFIASRFIIGFGVAISQGAAPLLMAELIHTQHRATYTTIYNTTWYFGSIIAAWLTFGTSRLNNTWCWRAPSVVQGLPSILQLLFIWFLPESPRWLIGHNRHDQALAILAKHHANGNINDEVVQLEYTEIKETIRLESECENNRWTEFFKTKGNRRRLAIVCCLGFFSQWSGNGLVSYYIFKVLDLVGVTNQNTQLLINGILQICNWIVACGISFWIDRIGRRRLFLISTLGMLVAFIIWTILSAQFSITKNPGLGKGVIVMIFLYYVGYNLAWSGLMLSYGVEILPFHLRAKGITILFFCIDLALFFNQYVNPVALDAIDWKYYIVYCVWLFIELVIVYFLFVETAGTPLEEIAKHFDGDDALIGGLDGKRMDSQDDVVVEVYETPEKKA